MPVDWLRARRRCLRVSRSTMSVKVLIPLRARLLPRGVLRAEAGGRRAPVSGTFATLGGRLGRSSGARGVTARGCGKSAGLLNLPPGTAFIRGGCPLGGTSEK